MGTSAKTTSLRLYYGLWPDDATRAALLSLQQSLRGRLVPYENLHLTLAFLGQQAAELLPTLKEALAHLPTSTLSLELDRVGYFSASRIAWAGMHAVPQALLDLRRELTATLAGHGLSFDSRSKFKPHITLARDAEPPPDTAFTPIDWQANQVVLVQSVTRPEGSHYEVLASRLLLEETRTPNERGPSDSLASGA